MAPDPSLRVIARVRAKTEYVAQVRDTLSALVEPTRRESGCLSYELLQNGSDPTDFVFVEQWASAAAERAHSSPRTFPLRCNGWRDCWPPSRRSVDILS
jgi:quinol monooxygenase YgiN